MTREEAANILDPEMDIQYLFDFIREHYGKRGVDSALLCECVDAEACRMGAEALREQREEFMPPCYQPEGGDGECAYQIYGPDDDEPIERCKSCPLCYSDKMRHHEPKTPCDLCLYNPPSSGDGKPCTMCPASSLPEPPKENAGKLAERRKDGE